MGDLANLLEIFGDAADEVPGLLVVVEAERQFLQMVEALPPHLRLDVDAEHMTPVGHDRHQPRVDAVDDEQRRRRQQDQRPVLARQQRVDETRHGQREPELKQARNDRAGKIQQEQRLVGTVVAEEARQEREIGRHWPSVRDPERWASTIAMAVRSCRLREDVANVRECGLEGARPYRHRGCPGARATAGGCSPYTVAA